MGIGLQVGKKEHLLRFLADAKAFGARVGEHPAYGGVNPGVHAPKSWHNDGLAGDINFGASGVSAAERAKILKLIPLAQAYGLGVIFAKDGTNGSARTHQGHLHVDVGSTTNLGRFYQRVDAYDPKRVASLRRKLGLVKDKPAKKPTATTSQLPVLKDGSAGNGVKKVQRGLNEKFPAYADLKVDGKFGPATEKSVKEFQRRSGLKADGVVGKKTYAELKKYGVKF
jgi:hypothetical protein